MAILKGVDIRLRVGIDREFAGIAPRKDWKYFDSHSDNVNEFRSYLTQNLTAMVTEVCDELVRKGVLTR